MKNGKRILAVLAVCALSLSMIAAAPSNADAPEALHNEQPVSGVLTGNAGGAFAFYKLDYPGDLSVVTIEMRYVPADPVTTAAVGFNVYGPNGYVIGQGQKVADTGGEGVLKLEYSDDNPVTWLVQVYNYMPNLSLSYSIVAEGLPEAAPTVTQTPVGVVATPEVPTTTKLTGAGYLAGNHGGAYALYKVDVVEDAPNVVVTMNWSPDDPDIAKGVGFVVYGPSGQVARATGTGTPGERKTTLPANAPGVYQVQVYNYIDGLTIQYTLTSAPATE